MAWNDDIDFPSVEAPEEEDYILPELDEDWNDWWTRETFKRIPYQGGPLVFERNPSVLRISTRKPNFQPVRDGRETAN
jgi:hypothetical protein